MGSIARLKQGKGWTFAAEVRRKKGGRIVFRQVRQFKRRTEARAWINAIESDLNRGKLLGVNTRVTLGEAIDRYLLEKLPHKSPPTQRLHRSQLNWFRERFGSYKLASISELTLSEIRVALLGETIRTDHEGNTFTRDEQTVNRYFQVLSNLLQVAKNEWKWLLEAPKISKLRERPKPRAPFSLMQLRALWEALTKYPDQRIRLIAWISMTTGGRLGEVCALRWANVDLSLGAIHFIENTKGGTRRAVPIPPLLTAALVDLKTNNLSDYLFPSKKESKRGHIYDWATKVVRRTARSLGIEGCFHSLRHSVASIATNNGVPSRQTQQLLGHQSISTTEGYSHVHSEHLRPIVDEIEEQIFK